MSAPAERPELSDLPRQATNPPPAPPEPSQQRIQALEEKCRRQEEAIASLEGQLNAQRKETLAWVAKLFEVTGGPNTEEEWKEALAHAGEYQTLDEILREFEHLPEGS